MHNADLFNKICNGTCSAEELEDFVAELTKQECDYDKPFQKYYSGDAILSVIEKYESKEIDGKFFANWMRAYAWILTAGFQPDPSTTITLRDFLVSQLLNNLDSLSYLDDSDKWYDLEDYRGTFEVLDLALLDCDSCKAKFAWSDEEASEAIVLIVNSAAKYFIRIYGELDTAEKTVTFAQVEGGELDDEVTLLEEDGYEEMQYGSLDFDE